MKKFKTKFKTKNLTKLRKLRLKRQKQARLAKYVWVRPLNVKRRNNRFMINYKNLPLLIRFISFEGKIQPRRNSRLSAKKQRKMAKAVKTARVTGLLPFIRQ